MHFHLPKRAEKMYILVTIVFGIFLFLKTPVLMGNGITDGGLSIIIGRVLFFFAVSAISLAVPLLLTGLIFSIRYRDEPDEFFEEEKHPVKGKHTKHPVPWYGLLMLIISVLFCWVLILAAQGVLHVTLL